MISDSIAKFAVSCLIAGSLQATPLLYNITDLGASAAANAINAGGQTAGTLTDAFGNRRALSNSTDITPAGATDAMASGINAAGQISGTSYIDGLAHATLWTGGGANFLATDAYAMGINNAGQVTGMAVSGGGQGHAFLYTSGLMTDLGVLGGGTWSSGYAVNDAGVVVGYGDISSGAFRAFTWSPATGMAQLGTFGGANSYAMAINAAGQIAGHAQTASGYLHAFITTGSGLSDLGNLGGGSSYAYGINSAGVVVGYSTTRSGDDHAFVYQDGRMYDLNALVAASGWVLSTAYGINDAGQIAGSGLFNGVGHAFLLNPVVAMIAEPPLSPLVANPEPSSAILLGLGVAVVAVWKARRRPA